MILHSSKYINQDCIQKYEHYKIWCGVIIEKLYLDLS